MEQRGPLPLADIRLTGGIAERMQRLVREKVLTYQWEVLNDRVPGAAKSHCVENFRIAAGLSQGDHYGMVFQDSDLYKWLEAVAYCLQIFQDEKLEALADEVCRLIGQAQGPDGYINTYYTLREPQKRFTNLQQGHELYCAGHFFEAAAAYYRATGKREILDTACRFADYLTQVFGLGEGRLPGYPGHQEVEVGLVKLYQVTGKEAYLHLADFFIRQRGKEPLYFEMERQDSRYRDLFDSPVIREPSYSQCHEEPVRQRKAAGHAVRALYMYSAMADLARLTENPALAEACRALYDNVTQRQMYVTGAVGSSAYGENFTVDYDLPNDTVYGESCASVALMMFASRMAALTGEGRYYDTVERAFFNRVLGGISQRGTEFFYVGPLEVNPSACAGNPGLAHVKPVRQKWYDVACCPTNIARTIMSLGGYAFGVRDDTLCIHIPLACRIRSGPFCLEMDSGYPFGDTLTLQVKERTQNIAIRKSGLAPVLSIRVNGEERFPQEEKGYFPLRGLEPGTTVEVRYDLRPRYVVSHPKVAANVGKAAVMRGPLVYCAEQADNGEGVACLRLPQEAAFEEKPAFSGDGAIALTARGSKAVFANGQELYQDSPPRWEEASVTLIPYSLWANRGEGEMRVYLHLA